MQVREALRLGLTTLNENNIPSAQLAAELLLMHVLDCDRSQLYTQPEAELSKEAVEHFVGLVAERSTGKPTQYITGHQEFWGLDFLVTPDVLIPRPETEHSVEAVLELAGGKTTASSARDSESELSGIGRRSLRIIDVGTGSGCIAIALASELKTTIAATDISWPALQVAWRNAQQLGMADKVLFV
jgi:release factor glutamine methyltransferase